MPISSLDLTAALPTRVLLLIAFAVSGCGDDILSSRDRTAPGIVLLIGDGMGYGAVDAGRALTGALAMESLPLRGTLTTSSASHHVTDSGAAATALATGVATYNGAIGVDEDSLPVRTILEAAESKGWSTGLVVTSEITHATPASFAAHVPSRTALYEIAEHIAGSGVDVLMGGGWQYFRPGSRPDGQDLAMPFSERGCPIWLTAEELPASGTDADCAMGLLSRYAMPPAPSRHVPLATLAVVALDILTRDPDGFFLMIEGSQIDWAAHGNDGQLVAEEMADFDAAVAAVVEYLDDRPNTVIVVTADHETGGLSVTSEGYAWSTNGHTAAPVPLFSRSNGFDVSELAHTVPIRTVGQVLIAIVDAY